MSLLHLMYSSRLSADTLL